MISIPSTSVGMETTTLHNPKQHSFTKLLITISLQLLLWSSLFTLSVQISLFALSKVDKSLSLTDVICITAAETSLLVISLHTLITRLQESVLSKWAKVGATFCKVIILFLSCTAVLLWITTVGLGIIFTLARQPTCRPANFDTSDFWRKGRVCYVQRTALVVSMLAFVVSFVLCFTYNVSRDPFAAGLLGSRQAEVCLSPSDLERRTPQMVTRHSTLSFKCRSMLSPIIASSPLRISSPLRATANASDEKSNGLGTSSPRQSIEKSPLLAKTPSLSRSIASTSSVESTNQPSTAYIQSSRTYHPSRVPTAYVPSPHGTHLYSPKHLPKAVVSAIADDASKQPAAAALRLPQRTSSMSHQAPITPKRAPPIVPQRTPSVSQYIPIELQRPISISRHIPVVPQRAPTLPQIAPTALQRPPAAEVAPIQTTSLYTSRRVSSTFLTPTSHMGPPLIPNSPSPERELDTFPNSPPVHMPLTRPTNLYQSRRAPTPYNHAAQNTGPLASGPLAHRRFPVAYTPTSQSRVPSSMLAPPPSVRRLNSARNRGHSFASNTSSVYSRLVTDPK